MPEYVCDNCIGDPVIKAEIQAEGARHQCIACQRWRRRTIELEALATRVDPVFRSVVGTAREQVVFRNGHVSVEPVGETPSFLMTEMLQAYDQIVGTRLVAILSGQHNWHVHDGGFDWYDDAGETLAINLPAGAEYHHSWNQFCDQLKHHRRFFHHENAALLDELLGPIVRDEWPPNGAIRTIGPDTDITHVYRGRLANEEAQQRPIYARRLNQLAAPAPGLAGSGRMNAAGISIFYGALDQDTCVAEVRAPVDGSVIIGRFEIVRPLRVLDLTRLDQAFEALSYFSPGYKQRVSYGGFMRGFHQQVRRVILPGRETLEYLPTQIVAEYLWAQANPPVDGIIFGSAQISDGANNLVLFPHAAIVEGAEQEVTREIDFISRHGIVDEDENPQIEDTVYFKPLLDDGNDDALIVPPMPEDEWLTGIMIDVAQEGPQPALRLGDNQVMRLRVRAIRYENEVIPVEFTEMAGLNF